MIPLASAWPDWLVRGVRAVKLAFEWVNDRALLGIPLDWLLRAALVGTLYVLLRRAWPRPHVLALCLGLLLAKEAFDIVATRDITHARPPNAGDIADIGSGLVGIMLAEVMLQLLPRLRRRH